jgi:hypothetical protein
VRVVLVCRARRVHRLCCGSSISSLKPASKGDVFVMAMVKCKECGKKISNTSTSCPHCGADPWNILGVHRNELFFYLVAMGIALLIAAFN